MQCNNVCGGNPRHTFLKSSIEVLSASGVLGGGGVPRVVIHVANAENFHFFSRTFFAKSSWDRGWSWTCTVHEVWVPNAAFSRELAPGSSLSPLPPPRFPLIGLRPAGTLRPTQGEPCSLKDSLVQGLQTGSVRASDFGG